ncbi:MAG: acetyl-CoA carboxylase carboxyltransferase subunit beta [Candidatus Dormibacteria bacterium]
MDGQPPPMMRPRDAARPLAAPGPRLQPVAPAGTVTCRACARRFVESRFEQALRVCPDCGFHAPVPAPLRLRQLADAETVEPVPMVVEPRDPLHFDDGVPYTQRLVEARERTGLEETFAVARALVAGMPVLLACMDFGFLGGSLGSAAGEQFAQACEVAVAESRALVAVCTSGGARMQEGIASLAQMARCSAGVAAVSGARLPYISVLADPCFGGVTASFAVQADIILAEPRARIGFAGGRVIEQASHDRLPDGFQTAEFLLAHGMVDMVTERGRLRPTIGRLLAALRR